MIKYNNFYINKIDSIVFIGFSKLFSKLIETNNKYDIKSEIITSTDQSKTLNLDHKIFDKIDDSFYRYLKNNYDIESTLFISLGSRLIFNSKTIKFFKGNLINFHGTRLPYDSGGGGYSWKIMRQDRIDNQLVHLIDEGIDTGPIIDNSSSIYPQKCILPVDFDKYSSLKLHEFYNSFISNLVSGKTYLLKPQVDYLGRYNPRLSSEENAYINWEWGSYELYNFINSFDEPYPGGLTYINSGNYGLVRLKSVQLHGGDSVNHPFMSGLVSRHDRDWIIVCTAGKYSLLVEKVIDSKGDNIINKIKAGDRFYTPKEILDKSNSKRITYNSKGKV